MALDTRWKNPPGNSNEQLFLWAQDLIRELRKGDYLDAVSADDIANDQLADMVQSTIKGRAAGAGTGAPQDLTATQATAILDNFVGDSGSGGTKGLVPAPAAGDGSATERKFLRADGVWAIPGITRLASGSVSSVATLDLALGAYTSYRGLLLKLYGWLPVTDGVNLTCQFSTDNGSTWITTGYDNVSAGVNDAPGFLTTTGSGSASAITLTNTSANAQVGNASNEGVNASIELLGFQLTTFWPRIWFDGYYISNAATPQGIRFWGGGANETAQDCTGLRFAFSSGNISSANYALYGYS